jgi:hypothetical protein
MGWFSVFCSWFLPPSGPDSTSPWSPLAPSCTFCLAISVLISEQQSAVKTSFSIVASFAESRLPVRFVLQTRAHVESGLQLPPVLASETFLLPVPLVPVLSLFPGGAVQHELLRSSRRCSPLPSSCPARDWLLLWCSVRKKVHPCSYFMGFLSTSVSI